ncbi:hypothetical protein IJ00_19725 [Calothrix sp. 336/3]|nr:hypothetical protein IJ00_19725 [Calothrix sp. 336/3]
MAYVCTNDVGGRLTMRRAPGQKSRQIMQIPAGANLRVIRSVDGSDGFQWFQVAYRGKMGFVRSDFVCNHES